MSGKGLFGKLTGLFRPKNRKNTNSKETFIPPFEKNQNNHFDFLQEIYNNIDELIAESGSSFERQLFEYLKLFEKDDNPVFSEKSDPDFEEWYNQRSLADKVMSFRGGDEKAKYFLSDLSEKLCGSVNTLSKEEKIWKVIQLRSHVWACCITASGHMDRAYSGVRDYIAGRFPELSRETADSCTAEILAYLYTQNPELLEKAFLSEGYYQKVNSAAEKNKEIEERCYNDPDYGLIPEKPIFVHGFGPHRQYMDSLCTEQGTELSYERLGSMEVDGICEPVDIYDLFLPNGKKYMRIYQCVYGSRNSTKAPKGLKLQVQSDPFSADFVSPVSDH